jgi:serine protease inhibitor
MPHHTAGLDRPAHDPAVSRRALLLGLTGALVATQLAACGRGGAQPPELLMADGVSRLPASPDAPVEAATEGMTAFAHALYRASASPSSNWVASPVSIATAFAMARVGARGGTASQLDKVFGYPSTGRDDAFNAITRAVVTADVPPKPSQTKPKPGDPPRPPVVCIGNALFTAQNLKIGADFLRTLAAQYGTGARPLDFASPDAKAKIDAWVSQQTAGRIKKLFDQLDPATLFVLANTVYLRADWSSMFESSYDGAFHRAGGGTVTATMMHQAAYVDYAAADGWQAVELPYAGGDLAMRIMLPPPGRSPGDMLAPATMDAVDSRLRSDRVELTVPRWDFGADIDLGQVLQAMGLTVPFSAAADFSGIAPGIVIDQAVHRANISVDQRGTEAAAATGIAGVTGAPAPPPITFVADRPFAFAILGGPSRVPLFLGHVTDPTMS